MKRQEHLEWCKKRAVEYVESGDLNGAFASMMSDIQKHPDTANHSAITLGMGLKMNGFLNTKSEMKDFILGFN
jgi:hypothetical protein